MSLVSKDDEKARVANIFDVARLAGVSHQTVSRVLNDLPNVRPATRERVENAIKQLRYRPSPAARALVTRRSRTIGLITTGGPDYGPSSTVLRFNEAARDARYAVSMASMLESDPESLRSAVELLLRQNVEAIVLIAAHRSALEAVRGIELGVPLIAVESSGRGGFHRVGVDNYRGARIAVAHLAELGHTNIVHLAGPADSVDAIERARGWRDELGDRGLIAREPLIGDWSPASGFRLGVDLIRSGSYGDFTAVFAGNDQMALGLIHALVRNGLPVPDRVSVIGFDDIPEAAFFSPTLTTMRQDFDELGRNILRTLLAVLEDEEAPDLPGSIPELIVRESTAPRA
ncbi:LacI family DNA-binding transcriptional regulator [Cryobacterium breve]|jgi:DNA-binding LacI/PurR family transcriptional regulator|uniref:LacI family DNA-binding transcriptional regulator n=1 Tax=Cryobacterium breve TaxID=1259258 RepID=A0ABY7NGZ0_9MICO|nr:LacI family DNA-binding transcriptional regulator [Cryobacterium breve]WBM81252.1 LacI family DNA-binding transcriptional regulator [Cryobacterium breve]